MLPKPNRLTRQDQFRAVFTKGRSLGSKFFTVWFLKSEKEMRLGVVISNKVSPLATKRNKIKRLVRRSFSKKGKYLPVGDYVVVGKNIAAGASPADLARELELLISKI